MSSKKPEENSHYENPYMRTPEEKCSFWQQIYNKDKNHILGRTPQSFARLLLFYFVFYLVLIIFFLICIQGLMWTISDTEPKLKLEGSLIGTNPGLGLRPIPSYDIKLGMIIKYNVSDTNDVSKWIDTMDNFLHDYSQTKNSCDDSSRNSNSVDDKLCALDINNWGNCTIDTGYGFEIGSPCIFLKLNKIYNWKPEYYSANELPGDMPENLKNNIKSLPQDKQDTIWVSCTELSDNGIVDIVYHQYGFPGKSYPFTNTAGYLSPLVPIQFSNVAYGETLHIECRVWAKNINYSSHKDDRQGSIRFKLEISS